MSLFPCCNSLFRIVFGLVTRSGRNVYQILNPYLSWGLSWKNLKLCQCLSLPTYYYRQLVKWWGPNNFFLPYTIISSNTGTSLYLIFSAATKPTCIAMFCWLVSCVED